LLSSSWQERSADAGLPNDNVVEAVINETNCAANVAPPSPEMRAAMRVMDTYTLGDKPLSQSPEAQEFYAQARQTRQAALVQGVGQPVEGRGVEARVGADDFGQALSGGVAGQNGAGIAQQGRAQGWQLGRELIG